MIQRVKYLMHESDSLSLVLQIHSGGTELTPKTCPLTSMYIPLHGYMGGLCSHIHDNNWYSNDF